MPEPDPLRYGSSFTPRRRPSGGGSALPKRADPTSFPMRTLVKLILEYLIPYALVLACIIGMVLLVAYAQWVDWTVLP